MIAGVDGGDEASLPVWERGLKFEANGCMGHMGRSLPVWERGLKFVP